ncbi:DUF29 domain-containing protein [Coleofasciculus sp.]|uniref:DUF29 domain-containing protein n=2 Tax=Coleofasciculus sp. TaxID=3100458 RepID=UPI003A3FD1AC
MGQFSPAYETDYYAWTQQQAQFLQQQQWNCLDIVNLVEEIESLGRQERRELRNRLGVLLAHLLKWQFQPQNRSRSWLATIREQRFQVRQLLAESPSLKPYLVEAIELAYQSAVNLAVRETGLSYKTFPPECAYSSEQVLESEFFPGEPFDFEVVL